MRRYYLQSGLWMSVLTLLILGGLYVAADLNATAKPSNALNIDGGFWSDIGTGFASDKISGRSAKIAAQNSFSLSLDANSAAGDQAVTSVNTSADQDVSIQVFGSRSGQSETVTLTARVQLQVSTAPCPDFDGDGVVGIPDFLLFVNHFGKSRGDAGYDAKYDLDENDVIGIPDFLIFVNDFGKEVDCSSSDGNSPDLVVESPSLSDNTLMTGQSFTLSATVRNQGTGSSAATTLRYYRSDDATISTNDTEVGTAAVTSLASLATTTHSIDLTAPASTGTYYYGACVDAVTGESNTGNNCSAAVSITVVAVTPPGTGVVKRMYWTDGSTIKRSNLDDSDVEDLVTTGLLEPRGIALDVSGGKIYWTDRITDKIQRSNLDGSDVEGLVTTGLRSPYGIALDVSGGKIYWTEFGTDKIKRSNLDGSDVEGLVTTGLRSPQAIALDVSGGKIYWTDRITDKIQRSNLNGSDVEDLVTTGLENPSGIALDVSGGKMYWTDSDTDKIKRSNLDGSDVEDLVTTGLENPSGIALDVSGGKMYWTDRSTIKRSNLDGSDVEDLVTTGLENPSGIALDFVPVEAGKDLAVRASVSDNTLTPRQSFTLSVTVRNQGTEQAAATTLRYYRSDDATISTNDTEVGTAAVTSLASLATTTHSIDLTAPASTGTYYYGTCVDAVTGESNTGNNCSAAVSITVVAVTPPGTGGVNKMYWTVWGRIKRSNLDGSDVENLVTTGLRGTSGIALDVSGGKMYWTNWRVDRIKRSNLDGSNVENLVTRADGLFIPEGIALDVFGGKMYWTEFGTDKIKRSNLDGSDVEDLVTTRLRNPSGIALDMSGGKMYWTEFGADRIKRSNLDGSNVENLVTTGLRSPRGIALDVSGGKMYWTDFGTDKIQRSNLDGSDVENLVTIGLEDPYGIALDVSGGKMYWTDRSAGKIKRSNLDGSGVETLVTGLRAPDGIALDFVPVEAGKDLAVRASVSDNTLTPRQSFTLSVTVRNQRTEQAAATTLRYYRSDDATISTNDTEVGTAAVTSLVSLATTAHSIDLTAPASTGTYYYGACVDAVTGESNTGNNCSAAVTVTVSSSSGGGDSGGSLGACRAGLVVNPNESCTYKDDYTFSVSSSGTGNIIGGGLFMSAGNSIQERGTINGVRWNFVASKNSGSNSWTIHTAN